MDENIPTDERYIQLLEEAKALKSLVDPERIMETNRIIAAAEELFDERLLDGIRSPGDMMADLEILKLTGIALHKSIANVSNPKPIIGYSAPGFANSLLNIFGSDENNQLNWDKVNVNYFTEKVVLPKWNGENPIEPPNFPGNLPRQMPRPPAQKSIDSDASTSNIAKTQSNEVAEVNPTYFSDEDNFIADTLHGSPTPSKPLHLTAVYTPLHIMGKEDVTDEIHPNKVIVIDSSSDCESSESSDGIAKELTNEGCRRKYESITDPKETKPTIMKPVDQVLDIIKKRGAIPFYKLVCDPQSFEMTVENIHHVSSLVKDRFITMLPGDNDQFVVKPIPAEERDSPEHDACEGYESLFTLDKETWEKMIKVFKIESAIIRIPDRD